MFSYSDPRGHVSQPGHVSNPHHNVPRPNDYLYDSRTHSYLSPEGTNWPAPPGQTYHSMCSTSDYEPKPQPPAQQGHSQLPLSSKGTYTPLVNPVQQDYARYGNDRALLGISRSTVSPNPQYQNSHPMALPRAVSHNPSPSVSPHPPLTRSWTLDSLYHAVTVQPSTHLNLPLTLSPLQNPSRPPSSLVSTYAPSPGTSVSSLSRRVPDKNGPNDGNTKRPAARSRKITGPPKAKLGGPGGKTFDEMMAAGEIHGRRMSASPVKTDRGSVNLVQGKEVLVNLPKASASRPTTEMTTAGHAIETFASSGQMANEKADSEVTFEQEGNRDRSNETTALSLSLGAPTASYTPLGPTPVANFKPCMPLEDVEPAGTILSTESPVSFAPASGASIHQDLDVPDISPTMAQQHESQVRLSGEPRTVHETQVDYKELGPEDPCDVSALPEGAACESVLRGTLSEAASLDTQAQVSGKKRRNGRRSDHKGERDAQHGSGSSAENPWPATESDNKDLSNANPTSIAETPLEELQRSMAHSPEGGNPPVSSSLPNRSTTSDSPTKRVSSAASLRTNVFIRKTLGGLLQHGEQKPRRSNLSSELHQAPVENEALRPYTGDQAVIADADAPDFVEIPLVTPSNNSELPAERGSTNITVHNVGPDQTKKASQILREQLNRLYSGQQVARSDGAFADEDGRRSPGALGAGQNVAGEREQTIRSRPPVEARDTITIAEKLRPSVQAFISSGSLQFSKSSSPSSRLSETKNTQVNRQDWGKTAGAARLRPTASSFIPTGSIRLVVSEPDQSSVQVTDASKSQQDPADDEQQAQKRAKLRPVAPVFVPRVSGSVRDQPQLVVHTESTDTQKARIAPDSFAFAPQMPNLRPTAPSFVPRGQSARAPTSESVQFQSRPEPFRGMQFSHTNPVLPPNEVRQWPAVPFAYANPAFLQRGAIPSFAQPNPMAYADKNPLQHLDSPSTARSHASSMDVSDMFYRRPLSTVKTELGLKQLKKTILRIEPSLETDISLSYRRTSHTNSLDRSPQAISAEDSARKPLPPLPTSAYPTDDVEAKNVSLDAITVTPDRIRRISVADTFTTSGGSPLIPHRPTPCPSPQYLQGSLPVADFSLRTHSSATAPQVSKSPILEHRATTPNISTSLLPPDIKVGPSTKDKRFRDWVFPQGAILGHSGRPSISRRHTTPAEHYSDELHVGVASTLAERGDDLRQMLTANLLPDEDKTDRPPLHFVNKSSAEYATGGHGSGRGTSTQSSVEFPFRKETRTLAVVNRDPAQVSNPGTVVKIRPKALEGETSMKALIEAVERIEASLNAKNERVIEQSVLEEIRTGLTDMREAISKSKEKTHTELTASTPNNDLERIFAMLAEQSSELSKVHELAEHYEQLDSRINTQGILETVRSQQQAVLQKLNEAEQKDTTAQTLKKIVAAQTEMIDSLSAVKSGYRDLHVLKQELVQVNGEFMKVQSRNEQLAAEIRDLSSERLTMKKELDEIRTKTALADDSEKPLRGELKSALAGGMAAEQERDALAKALRDALAEIERLNGDISSLRREALETKRKAADEKKTNQSLGSISSAVTVFHEELLSRLARLDEGMFETMGSRVKEYEAVLDRKRVMEAESGSLREKLAAMTEENTKVKLVGQTNDSSHRSQVADLAAKLDREWELRRIDVQAKTEMERKLEEMEKKMDLMRQERENAMFMANERATWARMTEVRLQALSQENVYWRQFALESDKKKYRSYMSSNPFQDGNPTEERGSPRDAAGESPPDTELKTPADGLRGAAVTTTPTRKNGEERASVEDVPTDSMATFARSEEVPGLKATRVEGEEGTPWSTA